MKHKPREYGVTFIERKLRVPENVSKIIEIEADEEQTSMNEILNRAIRVYLNSKYKLVDGFYVPKGQGDL